MIKPTDEMATAWEVAAEPLSMDVQGVSFEAILAGLTAVFALIDPVPDDVHTIYVSFPNDVYPDEYYRPRTIDGLPIGHVWRHECGCCFSTYAQIKANADAAGLLVTWEDK